MVDLFKWLCERSRKRPAATEPIAIEVRGRCPRRISLDGEQFRALVLGDVVEVEGIAIALKDVGFQSMIDSVTEAIDAWEARLSPGEHVGDGSGV